MLLEKHLATVLLEKTFGNSPFRMTFGDFAFIHLATVLRKTFGNIAYEKDIWQRCFYLINDGLSDAARVQENDVVILATPLDSCRQIRQKI